MKYVLVFQNLDETHREAKLLTFPPINISRLDDLTWHHIIPALERFFFKQYSGKTAEFASIYENDDALQELKTERTTQIDDILFTDGSTTYINIDIVEYET